MPRMLPDPDGCPWCGCGHVVLRGQDAVCAACGHVVDRREQAPSVAEETARERDIYGGGLRAVPSGC